MTSTTSRDHALRIAFWSVIATETVLFGGLIALRGNGPIVTPSPVAVVLACAATLALFAAAGALSTAVRRIAVGQVGATSRLLILAIVLGLAALGLELGCARLLGATGLENPAAIALRGLHLAHVAAAISLAMWVLALVQCGRVHRHHHDVLSLVSSYWYFVGVVWVAVWPVLAAPRA